MKTLADVFTHTLRDIYFAEQAVATALPDVIAAVTREDLKKALEAHLEETRGHVDMLETVFASIGHDAVGQPCPAITGLLQECTELLEDAESAVARHAGIIGCAQAIEHYEIARYGTLREWAKELNEPEAHELLTQILDQEKAANYTLTHLAVTAVNQAGGRPTPVVTAGH